MQPSDQEEAKWQAEFERLGRETVRVAIFRGQGFSPHKRELALIWLRGKEIEADKRERDAAWYAKWTLDAAIAAAVLAFVTLIAMLIQR